MEARFSSPIQTGPESHTHSCTVGYWVFPGVKRPGRGADDPPPSNAMVDLYLYPIQGRRILFRSLTGEKRFLSTPKRPDRLLGPTRSPIPWVAVALTLGVWGRNVKLPTHLRVVPRLMSGAVTSTPPFPFLAWKKEGQPHHF